MLKHSNISIRCAAMLLLAVAATAWAQPSDTIIANPKAVVLKRIWMVRGGEISDDRVGDGVGALGDIFGTKSSAFAVHYGKTSEWRVYDGGSNVPDTVPEWRVTIAAPVPSHAVVG